MSKLREFVRESNRIEGITRPPTKTEVAAHEILLGLPVLRVQDLEHFVFGITARAGRGGALLRTRPGMNVWVGYHLPPRGGAFIWDELTDLLGLIERGKLTPHAAHLRYESLHPFMDGNGRSGRALWAWQMSRLGSDPFSLPFLHRFYYQTLDAQAARQPTTEGVGS